MGKNIMLVDDAAFMRLILKNTLEQAGYKIVGEASDGSEALDMYNQCKPDLVFMDITMPKMDGLSAVKEILTSDSKANIIMCSAMGQQSMVVEAIKSGVKDFVVKPFSSERVLEATKKVIG